MVAADARRLTSNPKSEIRNPKSSEPPYVGSYNLLNPFRRRGGGGNWLFVLCCLFANVALGVEKPTATPARPAKPPVREINRKAEPLKIAFISYANPQQVVKDSEAIAEYLEPRLGVPVKGFVTLDYGSSIEAMRSGKADVAFVDPLAFMMAHEQFGAKPILLEVYAGGPRYHSCIWVRKDSGLRDLKDLRGKKIAFADQVDMSGHLLPRDTFGQSGLFEGDRMGSKFFKQVYFAGGDEQAMRALFNGFVDAAGVSQYAINLLQPDEQRQIVSVAQSIESPSHLAMVRPGLEAVTVDRLKQALLALDKHDSGDRALLSRLYGVGGYVEAELTDFADVAKVAARYGFVKKPEAFSVRSAQSR
ncbi:MAG: phosphate/phosphite/phosphonate ABC transporter substrate-binding protein [Verrucomicrobiales bacterium]|nr:phosphate/phosphite/phosphonate ABC transporter substrate-binding protein [Verrucomicrobiales bacterium]